MKRRRWLLALPVLAMMVWLEFEPWSEPQPIALAGAPIAGTISGPVVDHIESSPERPAIDAPESATHASQSDSAFAAARWRMRAKPVVLESALESYSGSLALETIERAVERGERDAGRYRFQFATLDDGVVVRRDAPGCAENWYESGSATSTRSPP